MQGFADAENAAKRFNKKAKVHLKIDTGMGRIGFRPGAELESALDQIAESCYVELEGAFTHFAAADVDPKYTEMQLARFKDAVICLSRRGVRPVSYTHLDVYKRQTLCLPWFLRFKYPFGQGISFSRFVS